VLVVIGIEYPEGSSEASAPLKEFHNEQFQVRLQLEPIDPARGVEELLGELSRPVLRQRRCLAPIGVGGHGREESRAAPGVGRVALIGRLLEIAARAFDQAAVAW